MATSLRKRSRESAEKKKLVLDLVEFKRDRILAEAADLFYERGYPGASVEMIGDRLGVTKPFVYYHFKSKLELLHEICQRGTKQALEIATRALSGSGTPTERLSAFVRDFAMAAMANHKYVTIYFREEIHLSQESRKRINRMRKEIDDDVTKLLEEGCAAGEFDVAIPSVTALSITAMVSYPFAWRRLPRTLDEETVCGMLAEHALRIVCKQD